MIEKYEKKQDKKSSVVGKVLIVLINIFFLHVLVFTVSYYGVVKNKIINMPGFIAVQKNIYFKGYRKLWQEKKQCIDYDEELIYVPSFRKCNFENPEFQTVLNFNKFGRLSENDLKKISSDLGIAVLGDSEAMGWGVNNNQTFSSILERKIKKRVYNLGVSSYGTYRQLIRLKKSGLVKKIDTIVIQYHHNDLAENKIYENFLKNNESLKTFNTFVNFGNVRDNWDFKENIKFIFRRFKSSFRVFYKDLYTKLTFQGEKVDDFETHYITLKKIFDKFDFIRNKKVYIFYPGYKSDEIEFINYPLGVDKKNKNMYFFEMPLKDEHTFKLDGHFNIKGHNVVANKIFEILNEK